MKCDELEIRLKADIDAIRQAIDEGRLEEAKSEIIGISLNATPGWTFSKEIGDLFFALGYTAMAGRYWYFLEDKSERMIEACSEFEHSRGDNPIVIFESLNCLPFPPPHAQAKMDELESRMKEFRQKYQYDMEISKGWRDRIALLGCAIIGFLVLFILIAGIAFIATWFK